MNEQLKLLNDYQNLDKENKKLDDAILKTEEAVKYYQAGKFLKTVSENLANLDAKAKTLISKYEATIAKISEINKIAKEQLEALDECEDDEIGYINKKYQDRVRELNGYESELNAVIKEIEAVNKEYIRLGKENKLMREQFAEYKPKFEAIKQSYEGKRNEIKKAQNALRGKIDANLLSRYEVKYKDKKRPVLFGVAVDKKGLANCTCCGSAFSVAIINELNGGNLCECDSCRSLVYKID